MIDKVENKIQYRESTNPKDCSWKKINSITKTMGESIKDKTERTNNARNERGI